MSVRSMALMATLLVGTVSSVRAQDVAGPRETEWIVDSTLTDAALAFSDPDRPVVYYNPVILRRNGPALSAFILEHEDAHIQLHHRRSWGGVAESARLRGLELDADCRAAQVLSVSQPEAVAAALRFFRAMGATRVDREHPSGVERAERILSCSRDDEPGEAARPHPAPSRHPAI